MTFHLRSVSGRARPEELLSAIRAAFVEAEGGLSVLSVRSMADHLRSSFGLWLVRAGTWLFLLLGGLALLLSVVGVYGLRAYDVTRRTREIGIRMAMGSTAHQALWLVLGEGLRLTLVGLGLGVLLSVGMSHVLGGFLYGVRTLDPLSFAAAPAVLMVVALLACIVPARRAARIDPMEALRSE